MGSLDGKAALVTGGTSGLGFAIAERFLAEGSSVVVTGRNEALGSEALERLRGSHTGEAWFCRADAADEDEVDASVAFAVEHLGGLDILINNAGINVDARLIDTPVADFDRVMAVNLRGPFLYARACYPHLAARTGCMIHIASDAGVTGEPEIGAYSISKAALIMLSKMFALDGGRDGVRSNCICPGDIEPGMRHFASPEARRAGRTTRRSGRRLRSEGSGERRTWPMPPRSSRARSRRSAPGPCCSSTAA